MTCRMAAGQQKKHLSSSNFHERCRGKKKKKLDSYEYILNSRSHIDLEWDVNQKRAVPKREQVGISWRDMSSFVYSDSTPQYDLADVISVPHEIFSLVDLTEVLSYEVWKTCLSEAERKFLMKFLPNGAGAEQVVHLLLEGDNHDFGNPLIEWSSSLCLGDLHPDIVLLKDKKFRASKRAYYYEINMYHKSMLEYLMEWKERWLSSEDTEKLLSEGPLTKKQGNLAISSERNKLPSILKETPDSIGINNGVTDRYLSYIKISKAQHQLLKKTTSAGDGIHSMSISRVLGDIKNITVHPCDIFEEEERKKLHEHWLQVAKKDLPAAFEVYNARKLQRDQWRKSVEQELAETNTAIVDRDVETDNTRVSLPEVAYNGDFTHQPADVEGESDDDPLHNANDDHMLDGPPFIEKPTSLANQEVEETFKSADGFSPFQLISKNQNNNILNPDGFVSSTKDMRQTTTLGNSYYQYTPYNDEYKSANDLSLSQPQLTMEHSSTQVIGLERNIMEYEPRGPLTSIFDVDNGPSPFCSFGNRGRTGMLSSVPRGPALLSSSSSSHEHMNDVNQSRLPLFMTNNGLPESSQFPIRFQPWHQLLEQRELRDNNLVTHQNLNKEVYPTNRYPIQENFPSLERNFAALQPAVNGITEGYNWFPMESQSQVYNSWSEVNSSSIGHCVGGGANTDGSLYSVLSNKMPTYPSYSSTNAEQYVQARSSIGGVTSTAHNVYGFAQQVDNPIIHDTATVPSLNSDAWMNIPRQSSGLSDSLGRSFMRPWNS